MKLIHSIIFIFFSLELLSQVGDINSHFYVHAIKIKNPDLIVLIDTVLYMDSLCNQKDICYKVKIKDTIIDDIRRYLIHFIGMKVCFDTTEIYGCFKYRNYNFLFEKNQVKGIGIQVSEDIYSIDYEELDAIYDYIPTTYCAYYLGRLWILGREWDWGKTCTRYKYPLEILSVRRN